MSTILVPQNFLWSVHQSKAMTNAEFDSFAYCIPALGLMRALKTLIISQVFDDLLYLQKDSAPNVTSVAEMYLFMIHPYQASTTRDCALNWSWQLCPPRWHIATCLSLSATYKQQAWLILQPVVLAPQLCVNAQPYLNIERKILHPNACLFAPLESRKIVYHDLQADRIWTPEHQVSFASWGLISMFGQRLQPVVEAYACRWLEMMPSVCSRLWNDFVSFTWWPEVPNPIRHKDSTSGLVHASTIPLLLLISIPLMNLFYFLPHILLDLQSLRTRYFWSNLNM